MFLKNIPFIYKTGLKLKHYYLNRITKKQIRLYLNAVEKSKLQLGTGQNYLDEWFNTDYFTRDRIYFLDVTKSFPIEDSSFDFVFSEHHVEHIHYIEALAMIKEIFRILKPGGIFKVITPDLKSYLKSYFEEDSLQNQFVNDILKNWITKGFHNAKNYIPIKGNENISFFVNDIFLNYEHKFIYDTITLKNLLEEAGFSSVYQTEPLSPENKDLSNIEAHKNMHEAHFNLVMIAVK